MQNKDRYGQCKVLFHEIKEGIKEMAKNHFNQNKQTDNAMRLHKSENGYKRADTIDFVITLIMVLIAVFAFRAYVFEPVRVSGESMLETLKDGERMFVEKFTYWFDNPSRGDIVICKFPPSYKHGSENDTYVKRVIGLPGETIKVENGSVYVKKVGADDYVMLQEDYIRCGQGGIARDFAPLEIPTDSVFVMGDNRNNSTDSRYSQVGPIKLSMIVGRVHGVVYPFNSMRNLPGVNYAQ